VCKIVGGDEGRRPEEEVGRTPRLEVGCIQRRVEGSGGVTHTETAEEVRKDWEVGEFFFLFFSQRISHTRQRPSERTTVHELLNKYQ
jgi:hypothetical protein